MIKTCENCGHSKNNNSTGKLCGSHRRTTGVYTSRCNSKSVWVAIKTTKEKQMSKDYEFKVGDRVEYKGKKTVIIGTFYKEGTGRTDIVVEYSSGWEANREGTCIMDDGNCITSLGEMKLLWVRKDNLILIKKASTQSGTIEKYNFRGKPEIHILCSEALKDKKNGFIVVGKDNACIGLLRGLYVKDFNGQPGVSIKDGSFKGSKTGHKTLPYLFKVVPKKEAHTWIKEIQKATAKQKKEMQKLRKAVRKERATRKKSKIQANHFTVLSV